MALFKCPKCGHKLSTGADACPKCGREIEEQDRQKAISETSALIECPECQGAVSTTVDVCPSCGYKITEEEKRKAPKIKMWYDNFGEIALFFIMAYSIYRHFGEGALPILGMMALFFNLCRNK